MYLIQTVSSSPRVWSSWSNINKEKDEPTIKTMNSVEEISTYKSHFIEPYFSDFSKTSATTYDFPERPPKKEKKWSFGSFFRRKKKEDSDSSNDEEVQKKSKKKIKNLEKRKRVSKPLTFDHIVVPPHNKNSTFGTSIKDDVGVLSDPFPEVRIRTERPPPRVPIALNDESQRKETVARNDSLNSQNSHDSADSSYKRGRRGRSKARAAARRDSKTRNESSSDDDSQQSYSSVRFKSDENIQRQRDNSASRRSRTARTERYNRRLSKDDESILNREAMLRQAKENWHLKVSCDSMAYGIPPNGSPIIRRSQKSVQPFINNEQKFSGLFTIPPSHNISSHRNPIYSNTNHLNSTHNYNTHSQKVIHQESETSRPCFNIRSLSCEGNIHRSPSPEPACDIIRANLPLKFHPRHRNLSLVTTPNLNQSPPPLPPPRDPRRLQFGQPDLYNARLIDKMHNPPHPVDHKTFLSQTSQWHRGFRTTSEDNIQTEPKMLLTPRPSSVTHETRDRYYRNHCLKESPEQFHYLTEKKPRSRRPIFIQSTDKINIANHNSRKHYLAENSPVSVHNLQSQSKPPSPQIFTSKTHLQTKIFLPSVVETEKQTIKESSPISEARVTSPFRPISSPVAKKDSDSPCVIQSSNLNKIQSNSKNLEEALDELEEIYKSLHLGDEDLLERAEQREMSIAAKKRIELTSEHYPDTTYIPRGAISDSGFNYESLKDPLLKKINKSQTLERRSDDMAFRKLNKDLSNSKATTQNILANVSYLLASPIHAPTDEPDKPFEVITNKEPDVTLDDVVYRSIKHSNNSLKVMEPQPPFGIPVGPVTPAPNSDYLHAVPEKSDTFTYSNKKEPDVVKDDLAFRNLRKDNKDLTPKPLLLNEIDNNININKKRRAVRSLSANISNIMHKENTYYRKHYDYGCDNEFKQTSLTDIADAMEIARQILKEKENKIYNTKKAFMSDDEKNIGKSRLVNSDTINENRLNFLNEMRSKSLDKNLIDYRNNSPTAESSIKIDALNNGNDTELEVGKNKEFEDLLTALAVEARETSDRITNDLKNLEVDLDKKHNKDSKLNANGNHSDESNRSEHTNLCKKLLECVVESTELIATPRTESTPIEEVESIVISVPETVANIVTTRILDEEIDEKIEPAISEIYSISEPDYDNMGSDLDFDSSSKSPFEAQRESIIASFADLNKLEQKTGESTDDVDETLPVKNCGGEDFAFDVNAMFSNPECALVTEYKFNQSECGVLTHMTNCNLFVSNASDENCKLDEYEPSSGFHSNSSCTDSFVEEHLPIESNFELDDSLDKIPSLLVESLKSPKLVTSAMKNSAAEITKESDSSSKENGLELHKNFSQENRASTSRENNSNIRDSEHRSTKTRSWYGDPLVIAFACSYGVACSYQLASLDIVATLAMLFVIISIAVAILYE